ncbi:RNA polymerase sigma factor [Pedobacter foliorum]|uniref:RNA polymerase sigma factor n=1 Tax=Pedobacter foliorum TaxID=2739058 RepID=UPI0015648AD6|nr:hypothetical protein [Pedobacter foliorum]NRF40816.1 hypothetical protein [Pedobacter foliorum]
MVYATQNDEMLLSNLREGDERAFSEIYDRYWKAMYQTANNIIRDEAAEQDAVQEVFISLWNRRAEAEIKIVFGVSANKNSFFNFE